MTLPLSAYKYFWDTDPHKLDSSKHASYIIERLLEQGDLDSLKWVNDTFPKEDIYHTIKTSRRLSAKTRNFFSLYYHIADYE